MSKINFPEIRSVCSDRNGPDNYIGRLVLNAPNTTNPDFLYRPSCPDGLGTARRCADGSRSRRRQGCQDNSRAAKRSGLPDGGIRRQKKLRRYRALILANWW